METSRAEVRQRWRIRVLAAVTIACTGVISFSSLRNLAEHAGFGWLAWLFPICIDCVAALGMDVWLSKSPAYRWGAGLALSAVALSLVGNISDWWIKKGTVLAALLGAVPPAALAFELFVMHRHSRGAPHQAGLPEGVTVQLAEEVWRELNHAPTNQPAPLERDGDEPTQVAPNGRVPEPPLVRPTPAPLNDEEPNPVAPRVNQTGAAVGAPAPPPLFPVVNGASQPAQLPVVQPDEEELVQLLRKADPVGEFSRRMAERFLTEVAGETVGSSRASRLMDAARNGQGGA